MLGKSYTATLLAMTLLIVTATAAASTSINKLELARDGGFTILTIQGDDQIRYAHQSVEAKEGKPFRIVVDCLASRHNLPRFHFSNLPQSIVTSIRTSQYAVAPEEVVRVVLDLAEESVYRVETVGNTVRIYVSDQKNSVFDTWTSGGTVRPPQEPKEMAKAPVGAKTEPATQQKAVPSVRKPVTVSEKEQSDKPSTSIARIPAPDNTGGQDTKTAPKQVKQDLAKDSIQRAEAFAALKSVPKTKPTPSTSQTPQKQETDTEEQETPATGAKKTPVRKDAPKQTSEPAESEPTSKPVPTIPSPVAEDKDKELAGADSEPEKIDISRHRRAEAKDAEMKSSQVVEFPKRLVIKYKKTSPRDPFETLIALESKKKRSIDLNKAPYIEGLHLVGILEAVVGKDAALLQDRDGIGYILRTGDRVQNGYVAQIDESAVYFQINEYGWSRTVVKHMEKEN